MLGTIDEDEKQVRTVFVSGQNRSCGFITEDGLYEILLMMKSGRRVLKTHLQEVHNNNGFSQNTDYMNY